jgi:serine protease Do
MSAVEEETEAIRSGFEDQLAGVAARVRRSTVQLHGGGVRAGSGVVWTARGLIVTNAHAVRKPVRVVLSDGRAVNGRVLAWDRGCDLAAIGIDAGDLPAVGVGDSDNLRVGQLVVAVGYPLGLPAAVTAGVIHAIPPGSSRGFIQADLRLAPGNSGGPLADARGDVVGINTMIAGGLACAVPSRVVERFLAAVRREAMAAP